MIAPTGAKSFKEVRDVLVERFIASSTAVSFQMFDVEPSANRQPTSRKRYELIYWYFCSQALQIGSEAGLFLQPCPRPDGEHGMAVKVYHSLQAVVKQKYGKSAAAVGDEGVPLFFLSLCDMNLVQGSRIASVGM